MNALDFKCINMATVGKVNSLTIDRWQENGALLDGGPLGQIFIHEKFLDNDAQLGQEVEVFIYLDNNGMPIATTQEPKIQLGKCAYLKCVDMNRTGAFFDWGLPKDLMVPYAEQSYKLYPDLYYVVYMYKDQATNRLVGSIKLSKHLSEFNTYFKKYDEVDLFICGKSSLGFKAVINESHLGLIHHDDVFKSIKVGQKLKGYIKQIREDKKINLCFNLPDAKQLGTLAVNILQDLKDNGGISDMTDKTPPNVIYQKWNVSKGSYKRALGSLYKQRLITISKDKIKLV